MAAQVFADHCVGDDFLAREVDLLLHLGFLGEAVAVRFLHQKFVVDQGFAYLVAQRFAVGRAARDLLAHHQFQALARNHGAVDRGHRPGCGGGACGGLGRRSRGLCRLLGRQLLGKCDRRQAKQGDENAFFHAFPLKIRRNYASVFARSLGRDRERVDRVLHQFAERLVNHAVAGDRRFAFEYG